MLERGRGYRIKEAVFRFGNRFALPNMWDSVRREAADDAFKGEAEDGTPRHIRVVDRGRRATIVSFSNAAMLHAGRPTREFESFFTRYTDEYNLIFLRDVHRSAFHYTPAGEAGGLAFHEAEIRRTLAELGSDQVIGIGDSGGAAAAIYFGVRCGFDRVVAFSPPFPLRHWLRPSAQLRAYFDLPLLLRDPGSYWEHVLLALSVPLFFYLPIGRRCGFGNIFDPIADYCRAERRPSLTVFYGKDCRPEANVNAPLKELHDVSIHPLPTARHFAMTALARTGRLGQTILDAVAGAEIKLPASLR